MNKIFTNPSIKEVVFEILPSLGISMTLAELFYKFGSFTFECMAFLGTWYLIGLIIQFFKSKKYSS